MIRIGDIGAIRTRITQPDDLELRAFDNTALVAINTCPTWGLVQHGLRKKMPGAARAMALEAGAACHEAFAAARLFDLMTRGLMDHVVYHGPRLFGRERFTEMMAIYHKYSREDRRTCLLNFALEALYSSGFYDDPRDKRRTMTNLEEACITYLDRIRWDRPVWVENESDPTSMIGIEIPFDVTVGIKIDVGAGIEEEINVRFIGRIDGVHWSDSNRTRIELEENKTGSRLDDAWRESFGMSHQVTGYMIALTTILDAHNVECGSDGIRHGIVHGLAIPQPASRDISGIERVPVRRYDHQIAEWFHWFTASVAKYQFFTGDELNAPKYTHSCNRYFRSCSFIPLCYAEPEERKHIIEEMEEYTWNPLEDASGD